MIPLPLRDDSDDVPSVVVASATFRSVETWFILLQNQFGDLLIVKPDDAGGMEISYFDTIPVANSILILRQGVLAVFEQCHSHSFYYISSVESSNDLIFAPSATLLHLTPFADHSVMSRLTKMLPTHSGLVSIHGSRNRSSLKVTRRGLPISQLHRMTIGGSPIFVKSIHKPFQEFDALLIVSSRDKTRVFVIAEDGRISENSTSGLVNETGTFEVGRMANLSESVLVQIHSQGIRILMSDNSTKNWSPRLFKAVVVAATMTATQIVVAFEDRTIVLFDLNERSVPIETSFIRMDCSIVHVAMPSPPPGVLRSKWVAVGNDDLAVYILSIGDLQKLWQVSSRQIVSDPIASLGFLNVPMTGHVLHIGHSNGLLTRTVLDDNEGSLGQPQVRFLGHSAVKIFSDIALCETPWLMDGLKLTQVSAESFLAATRVIAPFCSDGGFVGITTNDMVFFVLDSNDADVSTFDMETTPRQIVSIPESDQVCLLCSDLVGGVWRSNFRFFDTSNHTFSEVVEFEENLVVTSASFVGRSIVVGLARNLRFNPRAADGGRFCLVDPSTGTVSHQTDVEDIPGAIGTFQDCILTGVGRVLRVYRIGNRQLLKRCESRTIPFFISFVASVNRRIVVGDSAESFHFLRYDPLTDVITPFCDDATPRFPLSAVLLDRSSIASGDRFGNFALLRVPADVSDEAEVDPSGVGMIWEHPNMCGTPNKLDVAAMFHVGDPIVALAVNRDYLVFGTVAGQVGALVPLRTVGDFMRCRMLELELRRVVGQFCGRDHLMFRSYYAPLRNVVDGDLLMQYFELSERQQQAVADELKTTTFEIAKLLNSFESAI
jgi:splicing factor 3B subunit 3